MGSEGRDMAAMDDLGAALGLGGVSGTLGVGGGGAVPLGVGAEAVCGLVSLSGSAAWHLCSVGRAVPVPPKHLVKVTVSSSAPKMFRRHCLCI